jgi:hypothetical protein
MADVVYQNLDLKVMADASIGAVSKILAPLRAFGFKVEVGGNLGKGSTITVPFVSPADDATDFNRSSNNFTDSNGGEVEAKPVTLGTMLKSTFDVPLEKINELMAMGADGQSPFQKLWNEHAKAVVRAGIKKLQAQVSLLNFGDGIVVGASSAFDRDVMIDVRQSYRDVTGSDAYWGVMNMSYYGALAKDLSQVDTAGQSNTLSSGRIPNIAGFSEVIETNILDAGQDNRVGFVTDGTGLLVANWVPAPYDRTRSQLVLATDPDTGITLGFSWVQAEDDETLYCTVRACIDVGLGRTEGIRLLVSEKPTVATPTLTPGAGTDVGPVTLATTTTGATIYYTINGDTPTAASTLYTGPITLVSSATIKAIAIKNGYTNSAVGSAAYVIS